MRIIFMGTPDFAVPALKALDDAGHDIVAVYSQPPRPAGRRGLALTPSPVHKTADERSLPVFTPLNFKDQTEIDLFASHDADLAIVAAYGLLLPQAILDAPKHGCLNIHASLLPRWRGAAPIHRAIMAGDKVAGVTIMQMELGLDTGPMGPRAEIDITPEMTTGTLHDALAVIGGDLIVEAVDAIINGEAHYDVQPEEGVIYAKKIDKAEAKIDWAMGAEDLRNHIHGLSHFPGAWCMMRLGGKSTRVKVLEAALCQGSGIAGSIINTPSSDGPIIACGDGALMLTKLQKAGSGVVTGAEFMRGAALEGIDL